MSDRRIKPPALSHHLRGVFVPSHDVEAHLSNGWRLLDDCPGRDEALLAPPDGFQIVKLGAQR